jgi:hypothetical protein
MELAVAGSINMLFSGSASPRHAFTATQYNCEAGTIAFGAAAVSPKLGQSIDSAAGATGDQLSIFAQSVSGSGNIAGGPLVSSAGDTSGVGGAANSTGGDYTVRAGDANGASVSNVSGNLLLREGHSSGAGSVDGNISMHEKPVSFQSMQRGLFIGNAVAVPTGNPGGGGFVYVESGALKYRGSGGTITTMGPA